MILWNFWQRELNKLQKVIIYPLLSCMKYSAFPQRLIAYNNNNNYSVAECGRHIVKWQKINLLFKWKSLENKPWGLLWLVKCSGSGQILTFPPELPGSQQPSTSVPLPQLVLLIQKLTTCATSSLICKFTNHKNALDFAQEMQFELGENHYDERFEFVGLFQVKSGNNWTIETNCWLYTRAAKVGPKLAYHKAQTEHDNSDVTYFCVFVTLKQTETLPSNSHSCYLLT